MTHAIRKTFEYYPRTLELLSGPITISTLPGLAPQSEGVEGKWVYAPAQQLASLDDKVSTKPYTDRVFGLRKSHVIEHASADGDDHVTFILWVLSFLTGMRLSALDLPFLDATPIEAHALVDFVPSRRDLEIGLRFADEFWIANRARPECATLFAAAVHSLFIAQNPQHLLFERFIYLYTALDACFALANRLYGPIRLNHALRIEWMCKLFGMTVPWWAAPTGKETEVARIRNFTLHEALFMDQPLGFAIHGAGTNADLILEMEALTCRLLVALLGGGALPYVKTAVDTRQQHGLDL